ncbi:ATP synthase F1 subunit epsilon [Tundrisphaera lichenicola]|uniref:ATP synthase F1 subunit epsilon n=1 Tax=Tundrisphaera lichenicola TaxID=2029860 RepID=UPI003EBD24B2
MATANITDPDFGTSTTKADGKKLGHQIQCVVVTPERTLFDEVVEFVALPLFDGELGVLPGRSPLIGRLGYGELRTKSLGQTRRYFVDGGFAQVRDDVVTILTNRAIPSFVVDAQAAERELEKARALRGSTEQDQAERTRAIERARAQIRIASYKGKD